MFTPHMPPKVQLLRGFEPTSRPVTSEVIFGFRRRYLFKFTSEMSIDVVCLPVTNTFIPNEFLVTEVTENNQVIVSIKLWYLVSAKLRPKAIYRILENVDSSLLVGGVENFYFLGDIFNVTLDFIQNRAGLLDSLLLLCYPRHPRGPCCAASR